MLIYKNLEIEIPEVNYKPGFIPPWPDEIIINGEIASNALYESKHRYGWQATVNGIAIFYLTESGKSYEIPKTVLSNPFPGELRALIRKSGMSQRAFAEALGIPIRTLEDWLCRRRNPSSFTKKSVINKAMQITSK